MKTRAAFKFSLIGLFVLASVGCQVRRETDVSADLRYSSVVGKEYRTKGDFILFRFHKDDPEIQLTEAGTTNVPELNETAGKKFPFEYRGNWILGVLPTGSQFKVTKVIRVDGTSMGSYLYYNGVIIVGKDFEGWAVVPSWLGTNDFMPKFKPELVEEVVTSVTSKAK